MNITIVGGGTAGWLAAYTIAKSQPKNHKITVIESTEIGIIGAGEGATGFFTDLITGRYFDSNINIHDFITQCEVTNKLGIKFINWKGDNSSFFTPLDGSPTSGLMNDYVFKYVLSKFGPNKVHLASKIGLDYELERNYDVFNSFHFNANKVGQFFKEICLRENIIHIDAVVTDCIFDSKNGNIKSLVLKDGSTVESDFFIDCTGFSRVLMKKLNVGWKSYSKYLPCNSAIPFLLDYTDNDKIYPWTNATALSSGWMWDIPLQSRRGCGYVFNNNFITPEQAKVEVENLLGKEITPIKLINFDPGRSEKFWEKNVLSLGLSSCFVEPLQATSIHTTVAQLLLFVNDFLFNDINDTITVENQLSYNMRTAHFYDLNLDFVSMHYQGGRDDTLFWRHIKSESIVSPFAEKIITRSKKKLVSYFEIANNFGAPAIGLWNWSMAGLDLLDPKMSYSDLIESNMYNKAEKQFLKHITTNYN
jgi:hypothetical protein